MTGINFYSTVRGSNVSIPPNKVCGYRIKNPMMKKGFSDGVYTSRDNGVVNQKLSRYATEEERKMSGSNCEGNTNWLNHRKVNFHTPESADTQFWINRPAFKEGTTDNSQKNADPLPKNIRDGLGNKDITRNNFIAPIIKPRFIGDFEKLQALDISEVGGPEKLTDNKLGYFTKIRVPDPNDFQWLREKARLEAQLTARFRNAGFPADEITAMVARELEINKPLGREQRTIARTSDDIANSQLSTKNKVDEIIQEVRRGRVEGRRERRNITGQLIQVLNDTQAISNLAQNQLQGLGEALARIGVPTSYKRLGLIPRFVDVNFYNANAGMINLLFFSKVRETPNTALYNYDKLVRNYVDDPVNGLPPRRGGAMKLTSMVGALGRPEGDRRYIDLERGGVISRAQLRAFAAADNEGGFGGPNFDVADNFQ